MNSHKKYRYEVLITATSVIFLAGALVAGAAWNPAPLNPPSSNTDTPVNVGSAPQIKTGNIGVNALAVNSTVLVGNAQPPVMWPLSAFRLWVNGNMNADDFCLNSDPASCLSLARGYSNIQSFDANGSWTAPTGVWKGFIKVWGGGGGGGSSGCSSPYYACGGGGGGSGAYSESIVALTPGRTYQIVIGQGGAGVVWAGGGAISSGGDGGKTTFFDGSSAIVSADGGKGGGIVGGAGATVATGQMTINGSDGTDATYKNSPSSVTDYPGSNPGIGGSAPNGGSGGYTGYSPSGVVPGGGGGGAYQGLNSGAGASGRLIIYW